MTDDDEEGNGCWYVLYSEDDYENYGAIPWGVSDDVPVPGDYDGDGRMDVAVWRPSDGMWHIRESSNGYFSTLFGANGDTPIGFKAAASERVFRGQTKRAPANVRPQRKPQQRH